MYLRKEEVKKRSQLEGTLTHEETVRTQGHDSLTVGGKIWAP